MSQQPYGPEPEQPWGSPPQQWETTAPPHRRRQPNNTARVIALATVIIAVVAAAVIALRPDSARPGREVSRANFELSGLTWPLTVDRGRVGCTKNGFVLSFRSPSGTTYALNGTAQTMGGLPPIDPIWASNPEQPDLRVAIGDLLNVAQAEC